MSNNNVIETKNLTRIYKLGDQEVQALRGVNLEIGSGQFVALKGRSGSGKTTLLNCIGGLDKPSAGSVSIFGEEIGGWNENKLTAWRRQQVGFIFQSLGLLPALSAAARRLHDTNRSGWWMLIAFTIIGLIPLIIWLASKGNDQSNEYGSPV